MMKVVKVSGEGTVDWWVTKVVKVSGEGNSRLVGDESGKGEWRR